MLTNAFLHQSFKAFPQASVLLKADSQHFTILDANDALLAVANIKSANLLIGKSIFEVFPDNPNDADANGVSKLKASLCKTVETGTVQDMPPQRYDIEMANTKRFIVKYWSVKNIPLFNEDGSVGSILHTTIDVTESILAQQKEAELLSKIKTDIDFSNNLQTTTVIGSWDLDLETQNFYWSPEFFDICGYTPNAFTPSLAKALEIIHPDDHKVVTEAFNNAIEKGESYRIEHRIITATNQVVSVLATGIITKNKEGKNSRLTGFFQNITGQKQQDILLAKTLEVLVGSEKKYKQLFENNPLPLFIWDFKTLQIIECNEEALLLYGYSKEEFLTLTIKDIRPKEDIDLIEEMTRTEAVYGRIHKKVWRHKKKNGEIIFLYIVGHLFIHHGRKVSLVSLNDVTEKIKVEEALKESETRYKSFFNNSLDANLLSIENGKNLAANPVACNLFGYTEEEFCNLTRQTLADRTDERLKDLLKNKKATGHGEAIHRLLKKDGSAFEAIVSSTEYIDINGEIRNAVIIKDVTEKIKAEQALAESDRKYRLLFYQAPIPKWIYEIGTYKIIDVNEAAIEHYGYSREEFLNLTILDLRPADEVHKLFALHQKSNTAEGVYKAGKFVHKKKNGHIITVDISSMLIDFDDKKCKLVIANDITDVEYALKELAISNERFYYATKATSDAIWDWDLENDKLILGDGFENIFGYPLTEKPALINFLLENIHPDDKQQMVDAFYNIVKSKEAQCRDEFRFKKADGSYTYVVNKGVVIRNDIGRAIRIVGGMRDITKHKKELLRLQLLESVITNINDGVIITEAEISNEEQGRRIVYINEAFTNITGYTEDDVIGKNSYQLMVAKTDKNDVKKIKNALSNWQSHKTDIINYKKNGEPFWANLSISPVIDDNGICTNWVAIQRDVTEQKLHVTEMIKAIIKTQEDERIEIGGELHDNICQVLATSKIAFKMLEKNIVAVDKVWFDQGIKEIDIVFKEIRNLSHRLAPAFFKDGTLEESLTSLVRTFNIEDHYNIVLQFDDSFKIYASSREFQLNIYRILQEQLRNIVKYAEAKNITISGITTSNSLKMMIQDDGIGFNPTTIKSGIGLANMKRRAELFGGKLIIDSELGKGCTINVEVPLSEVH